MPEKIRPQPKATGKGLAGWQAELALRLLLDASFADFPVAALARCCGLSRSYFIRAFKVSMGLPPHHWLMRRRIERAQALLVLTSESIAEIAIGCGFADQSHLTRVFHNVVGESPAAWRRWRRAHAADLSRLRPSSHDDAAGRSLPDVQDAALPLSTLRRG